jgi:hypothetical protein
MGSRCKGAGVDHLYRFRRIADGDVSVTVLVLEQPKLRRERGAGPHAAIREGGAGFPPSLLTRADHVIDQ